MSTKKLTQIIPQTLVFTPAGGTAVSYTDFADPVSFSFTETYAEIASQSSDYAIGKMLTGKSASIKTTLNNIDLLQLQSVTASPTADYVAATDTLTLKAGSFDVKYGVLVLTGYDTAAKKNVTITLAKCVPMIAGDIQFGKAQEARMGVQFDAVRDTATGAVVTIVYSET